MADRAMPAGPDACPTDQPPKWRPSALECLAAGAAAVTVLLTAAAFWLSYEHLHDVADANGLQGQPARSWAWPATIDAFIIVGELLILRASLAKRVDPWAIGLTVVGSGGSIALNVAGVGAHAQPMEYVVAAVPPVAALLAFGALMRQVHEALARRTVPASEPPRVPTVPAAVPVIERVPTPPVPEVHPELPPAPQAVPAPDTPDGEDELTARARLEYDYLLADGRTPSIRTLRDAYSIGQPRAYRIKNELKGRR